VRVVCVLCVYKSVDMAGVVVVVAGSGALFVLHNVPNVLILYVYIYLDIKTYTRTYIHTYVYTQIYMRTHTL